MRLLDLEFPYPFMVAAGPLTRSLDLLKEAEDSGAGAASTKLTFSKLPYKSQLRCYSVPGQGLLEPTDARLDFDEGLELVRRVREETSLIIAANLSGVEPEDWGPLALAFEGAGAHLIEANFCCPHLGLTRYLSLGEQSGHPMGASIGQVPAAARKATTAIKAVVSIPVICKIPPSNFHLETSKACESAGADAIHIFGGPLLGLPPVAIYDQGRPMYPLLDGAAFGSYHGPCNLFSTFRYVAELRRNLKIPVIASGGIKNWQDAIMMIMWGASAVAVCTQIIWHGFEVATKITEGMGAYLRDSGFKEYLDLVGLSLRHLRSSDQVRIVPGAAKIDKARCTRCGRCLKAGHCNAIEIDEDALPVVIERKCLGCGICESLCPCNAITLTQF